MKLKLTVLLLLATMITGCSSDDDTTTSEETQTTDVVIEDVVVTNEDFSWEVDNTAITIDASEGDIINNISEEPEYFEAVSCAYDGIDKNYIYNDYTLVFYEEGDDNLLQTISLKSDLVSTLEGASIGDSSADIIDIYGTPTSESDNLLIFQNGETELRVVLENDLVVLIEIYKIF